MGFLFYFFYILYSWCLYLSISMLHCLPNWEQTWSVKSYILQLGSNRIFLLKVNNGYWHVSLNILFMDIIWFIFSCISSTEQLGLHVFFFLFGGFRQYCRLLKDAGILSCLWKLSGCETAWLRAVCLSAFACELQITARQHRACSRQRQGFALSSAPCSCLWVLCHMTLSEIDPLLTSRSCCVTQSFIWCCNHHLKDERRSSPLSTCNWVTMTRPPSIL